MHDTQKNRDSWFERLAAPHDSDNDGSVPAPMEAAGTATSSEVNAAAGQTGSAAPSVPPPQPTPAFESPATPIEVAAQPRQETPPAATDTMPIVPRPSPPSPAAAPAADLPGERPQGAARKWHLEELKHRWLITQAQLLDDPRQAVEDAGALIDDAMHLVSMTFTEQRERIEQEWRDNTDLDTDALRAVMRRYRKLFQYVLAACQLPEANGGET